MNYGYFEEEADFYMGSKGGGGEEEVLRRARTIAQIEGLVGLKREQASLQSTFQQGNLVGEKKRQFSCVKSGGNVAWICLYCPYKLRQHEFISLFSTHATLYFNDFPVAEEALVASKEATGLPS